MSNFEGPPVPPIEKPKKKEAAKPRPEDIIKVPVKIDRDVVGTEGATLEKRPARESERMAAINKAEGEAVVEEARRRKSSERAQAVPKIEKKSLKAEVAEEAEPVQEEEQPKTPPKIQRGKERFY